MKDCLRDKEILKYVDGDLNPIEYSKIRDHLLLCNSCKKRYDELITIEKYLKEPVEIEMPESIAKNVMRKISAKIPLPSLIALITATFVFIISWIYIYFDFSSNSIFQIVQTSSKGLLGWIGGIVKVIAFIFEFIYAIFITINSLFYAIFKIKPGVEIIGFIFISIGFLMIHYLIKILKLTKLKPEKK